MDGDVVWDMVHHFNKKAITLPSYNARSRKLPIYRHNALRVAKPCHILQFDLPRKQSKLWKNTIKRRKESQCMYFCVACTYSKLIISAYASNFYVLQARK